MCNIYYIVTFFHILEIKITDENSNQSQEKRQKKTKERKRRKEF